MRVNDKEIDVIQRRLIDGTGKTLTKEAGVIIDFPSLLEES